MGETLGMLGTSFRRVQAFGPPGYCLLTFLLIVMVGSVVADGEFFRLFFVFVVFVDRTLHKNVTNRI